MKMNIAEIQQLQFKTKHITVDSMIPGVVSHLNQLPVISYNLADEHAPMDGAPLKRVYFNIEHDDHPNTYNPSRLSGIAGNMLSAWKMLGARFEESSLYYNLPVELLAITLTNVLRALGSTNIVERRNRRPASISGNGNIYVPLPKNAFLSIHYIEEAQDRRNMDTRDIIFHGRMIFFGQAKPFTIHHAHCQGFEFVNIADLLGVVQDHLIQWFPFLEGHVSFYEIEAVTNPVSHQNWENRP